MSGDEKGRRGAAADAAMEAENEQLKQRLRDLGAVAIGGSDELSPELRNRFLRDVLAFEVGPATTLTAELERIGIHLPAPETLSDEALTARLWEVIHGLSRLRVFLYRTDHLDDRALYEQLYSRVLPDEMDPLGSDDSSAWHVDLLGTWGPEETRLHWKYYADTEARRHWLEEFPNDGIPPHEDLPYDRDRLLPACRW